MSFITNKTKLLQFVTQKGSSGSEFEVAGEDDHRGTGECGYCMSVAAIGDLGRYLAHMSGAHQHTFDQTSLAVVSKSLAFLDAEGRRAHGMFSLLGDAAITYILVDKCFGLHYDKSKTSDVRAECTTWTALTRVFIDNVPEGLVQFPANVDPGSTRSGGEALKAMVGVVVHELGMYHAGIFAENVGVYSSYESSSTV